MKQKKNMAEKISKPNLKPIDSIIGITGKNQLKKYLTTVFNSVGFEYDNEGVAFAKYKGFIDNKEVKIIISILKRTQYKGLHPDHWVKYRTFQGIRMHVQIKNDNLTRFIVSKKTTGFFLKAITKAVMKRKGYKRIKTPTVNFVYPEVWSVDKKFGDAFVKNKEINHLILKLTEKKTKTLSWGIIIEPNSFNYNATFENLDDFDQEKLKNRLQNIVKMMQLSKNLSHSNITEY